MGESDCLDMTMPPYRPHAELLGLIAIVLAVAITAIIGASPLVIITVTVAVSVVVGAWLIAGHTERWQRAEKVDHEVQLEIDKWHRKWQLLRADARQTETALAQMLDGLIMVSPDGSILLINKSARSLLGLSRQDDLVGRQLVEVVRIPELHRAVESANLGVANQVTNLEVIDGKTVRPLRVQIDRITQADSSRLLLMFRDETETRRVEEMRREFIANVSHELKTPLAAIKGYAETVELAINDDPEAASHFMSQIHSQCLRLERLVSDMMQLARAQAGAQFIKLTGVSLDAVVTEALKSCRPVAEAKSIHLTVEGFDDEAAVVHANQEAVLTIANNLIGNAIRYTPAGGHVCVSCRQEGDHWALVVTDDGIGIPISDQDRIFERFYRVDKARESADGGTGIGLSIVKNLTLALGGQVAVSSRPNQGASFQVLLPAARPGETSSEQIPVSDLKAGA
jgi:two-component system phosphate regulon sensor histidine kinase PhoR